MTSQSLFRCLSIVALALGCITGARTTTINFDTDAFGNPLAAPAEFRHTTPLTELYAPLGIHFEGPAPGQGGAILNLDGTFGINPRSGRNFLGFNRTPGYPSQPFDPEYIRFDAEVTGVSIYAGDGFGSQFTMTAFDALDNVVGVGIVTNVRKQYALLSVSAPGIRRVSLEQAGRGSLDYWVYDDLTFNTAEVPEPASLLLLMTGALPGVALLHRRRS